METLANLAKLLRRMDCCSRLRALRDDVSALLASGRATEKEIAEAVEMAVALRVVKGGDCIV